jgi:hypothetical protein
VDAVDEMFGVDRKGARRASVEEVATKALDYLGSRVERRRVTDRAQNVRDDAA